MISQIVGVPPSSTSAQSPEGHPHVSIRDFVRAVEAPIICDICANAVHAGTFLVVRAHKCEAR